MKKVKVLILGIDGLVGNTVYSYLSTIDSFEVLGTSRKKKGFFKFDVNNIESIRDILKETSKVNIVINCIGETRKDADIETLIRTNSLFPQQLACILSDLKIGLIHVSTDVVYSDQNLKANEYSKISPQTTYAASKLLGEPNTKNTINIRTSIIGLSPNRDYSLLDRSKKAKDSVIDGYTNQNWSGCTTIQFAKFCEELIADWKKNLGVYGQLMNFSPIRNVSHYEILNEARKVGIVSAKIAKKKRREQVVRKLVSVFDKKYMNKYTCDIRTALDQLVLFQKS